MPNTINIVQPKAEDGTEISLITRTNSIYKSDGSPLGDSMDAYMDEVDELSQNLTAMKSIHLSGNAYCLAQNNGNIAFTLPLCGDYSQVTLNKNSKIAATIYGLTSATGCTLTVNSATIETKTLRIYFTPSVTLSTYTPAAKGFLLNISEDLTATLS